MKPLKLMLVLAFAIGIAACGDNENAEETAEDVQEKTEEMAQDTQDAASDAWDDTKEGAQEMKEETAEAMDDAQESDAWQTTKDRANAAWAATKEYSMEAWEAVRESFQGDMTPEERQAFDQCKTRLQRVEGLTEDQAERGCWRMMEEDTTEDYYAEKGGSDFWSDTKSAAGEAWDATKEGSKEAWDATKEGSKKAWAATKEYSAEAWNEVKESFQGDMTAQEKQSFDACVKRLQKDEGLTQEQAERGCWRMMEEGTLQESGS